MRNAFLFLIIMIIASCSKEKIDYLAQNNLITNKKKVNRVSTSLSTISSLQTGLSVLFNVNVNGNDFMTTTDITEATNYPLDGQSYYIPKYPIQGQTDPFYRLYNGIKHMTSMSSTGEGDFKVENTLGHGWKLSSAPAATAEMFRGFNSGNGDFTLLSPNYSISGYTQKEYFNSYAYPRYKTNEELLPLVGNAVTIKSNLVAGGTVWELTWNGKQFVNHLDYGREIQSSLNLGNNALPTEGGDKWSDPNFKFMHGSPLLVAQNTNKTQITRAIPLEWNNDQFNSTGNIHDLIIYKDFRLGKELTLDAPLNLGSYNYLNNQIIEYKTTFYTPADLSETHIEIPTAYLNIEFDRFFEIDATQSDLNQGLTEVILGTDQSQQSPYHDAGGIVISTQDLNYAMGVYINIPKAKLVDNDPNAIYYFRNWKFGNTTKWSAGRYGTIKAGDNTYKAHIIVGTLNDVRTAMRVLYTNGY